MRPALDLRCATHCGQSFGGARRLVLVVASSDHSNRNAVQAPMGTVCSVDLNPGVCLHRRIVVFSTVIAQPSR